MEERVATLEAELAFQGETVQVLNDALASQQKDLLLLQRQVELLGKELRTLRERGADRGGSDGGEPVDEKPPHY